MAKRHERGRNILATSETAAANARAYQKELSSGNSQITLQIAGNQSAEFSLVTVPTNDINSKTKVVPTNARLQKNLNKISLSDILDTLALNGQQFPAIGFYDDDGLLWILDGSRRRRSCELTGHDFLVYATENILDHDDQKYLTRVASVQKPLSLFERGLIYSEMIRNGVYVNDQELADKEGISKSTVSIARSACELRSSIISHIPDISGLGRPSINKLKKATEKAEEVGFYDELDELVASLTIESLMESTGSTNAIVLNAAFVNAISIFCEKETTPSRPPARQTIAEKGKTSCSLANAKNGFNLKLMHISDAKKEAVLAAITKIIEGE
jgi:ParB/RepB/Spo0J family partition protein